MKMFGPPVWASTSQRSSRLSSPDPSSSSSRNLGAQLGHREHVFRHLDIVSTSLSDIFFTLHHWAALYPLPSPFLSVSSKPRRASKRGKRQELQEPCEQQSSAWNISGGKKGRVAQATDRFVYMVKTVLKYPQVSKVCVISVAVPIRVLVSQVFLAQLELLLLWLLVTRLLTLDQFDYDDSRFSLDQFGPCEKMSLVSRAKPRSSTSLRLEGSACMLQLQHGQKLKFSACTVPGFMVEPTVLDPLQNQ